MASTKNQYEDYRLNYRPDWESLKREKEIGRGAFGIVFEAQVRRPGMFKYELCAVKRIPKNNHNFPRKLYEREIANSVRMVNVLIQIQDV
jgi:hypothetical protein